MNGIHATQLYALTCWSIGEVMLVRIFLSYRRADSAAITGRIYDRLVAKFEARNVFKDVDAIPAGVDFVDYTQNLLRQSDVALIIIGRRWLEGSGTPTQKQRSGPSDWVRFEVENALMSGIPIIPLLVDGAMMPTAAELPPELESLARINAMQMRNDPDFARDMERLVLTLERAPTGDRGARLVFSSSNEVASHPPAAADPARRSAPWIAVVAAVLVVATLGALLVTHLPTSPFTAAGAPTATATRAVVGQWRTVTSPTTSVLSCIAMVSANEGWILGENGTILHYTAGQWRAVSSPNKAYLKGIAMVSASEGWAVGFNGTILHLSGRSVASCEQSN